MPKISELPLASKLKEEDYIPIVQDGVTKRIKGTHFVTEEEYSLDVFSPVIIANNKAMYKLGEGDATDFSYSTYDGQVKSAILKGRTLVNLLEYYGRYCSYDSETGIYTSTQDTWIAPVKTSQKVKVGVPYTLFAKVNTTSDNIYIRLDYTTGTIVKDLINGEQVTPNSDIFIKTTIVFDQEHGIVFNIREAYGGVVKMSNMMLIEGDYTNIDIPYFEGMQSVKMPVLTITGKNLFNMKNCYASPYGYNQNKGKLEQINDNEYKVIPNQSGTDYGISIGQNVNLKANIEYSVTFEYGDTNESQFNYFSVHYVDGRTGTIMERGETGILNKFTFTPTKDINYVWFTNVWNSTETVVVKNIQIEQGSTSTTYEPYKSNILTTNEVVELRDIGDVRDELNLLTGELTQRVGEIVLDGSEMWVQNTAWNISMGVSDSSMFNLPLDGAVPVTNQNKINLACDRLSVDYEQWNTASMSISIFKNPTRVSIVLPNSIAQNISEFKQYLQQSPVTIQYQLVTPIVKTVDLSGAPFGYKGGHIIKSNAEGSLLPKFEYEVAVSRGAQISQNTTTLIRHDEKISELLKKTATVYINQKVKIANLLDEIGTQDKVQTVPLVDMTDSDMVLDNMGVEHEIEIVENPDSLLINLIYDLIELNDTFELLEKVEVLRRSGLIDKQNYEVIKVKLNRVFEGE